MGAVRRETRTQPPAEREIADDRNRIARRVPGQESRERRTYHAGQDAEGRRKRSERETRQEDQHTAAAAQLRGCVLDPDSAELEEWPQQPGIQHWPPHAAKRVIENVTAHARRRAQQRQHEEVRAVWLYAERTEPDE